MNPILLQKQLKENANDLQDFYKDLKSWGEEMKHKEDSLKNNKTENRKKIKMDSKTLPKSETDSKEKATKSVTTDYSKWEKYDADLECERLEDDIKDDSELTDEFENSAQDEALVHKEKGNSYVKNKDWDKAIDCYTKAINCYSYDPVFYANRALCYLKKADYVAAERDCNLSLKLDNTYVKALQRRAAARENLGKLELARDDLENVLSYEPKNKESQAALRTINKKLGSTQPNTAKPSGNDGPRPISKFTASRSKIHATLPSTSTKSESALEISKPKADITVGWPDPGCEIIPVKAIDKPPHLRSKKPLKRIEIIEINNLQPSEDKPMQVQPNLPEPVKKHVVEKVNPQNDVSVGEPIERTSLFKKKKETEQSKSSPQLSIPIQQGSTFNTDNLNILEKKPEIENTPKDVKNNENFNITQQVAKTLKKAEPEKPNTQIAQEFTAPKTSVQFYAAWKNCKTNQDKYKYLKMIEPDELPKIFQESLECSVFSSILDILSTQFIEHAENVFRYLVGLSGVKRFSALTIFMDSKDKNCLWKLIAYLREQEKCPKERIDELIQKYEL